MLVEFSTNGNFELAFASVDLRLPLPEDGSRYVEQFGPIWKLRKRTILDARRI